MYEHILLELYCGLDFNEKAGGEALICESNRHPSYACLANNCPYATFTSCENALCYIGSASSAEKLIAFGEEENKELWQKTATKKIDEAYEEYLRAINPDPTQYPHE